MTLSGPLALLANQTTGDKFYIRGVRPSPRPPPGAMEPEPGGAAAALLRQKRAALRRRGCSFKKKKKIFFYIRNILENPKHHIHVLPTVKAAGRQLTLKKMCKYKQWNITQP